MRLVSYQWSYYRRLLGRIVSPVLGANKAYVISVLMAMAIMAATATLMLMAATVTMAMVALVMASVIAVALVTILSRIQFQTYDESPK